MQSQCCHQYGSCNRSGSLLLSGPYKDLLRYRNPTSRLRCLPAAASDRQQLLVIHARQLYENVWSEGKILLLDAIMAEDHAQIDRVWQETAGVGRRRMKRGILAYRAAYPDIKFAVQDVAAVADADKVFVHWKACGTNLGNIREQPPTGRRVEFAGISLLEFNAAGQIQSSLVFRQAPEDEMQYFLSLQRSDG